MSDKKVICPQCGSADQVYKVSGIYLEGFKPEHAEEPSSQATASADLHPGKEPKKRGLFSFRESPISVSRRFAPPSGGNSVTRAIHPDMVVIAISFAVPIFFAGIVNNQTGALIPAVIVLALFYSGYLFLRKEIITKFEREQTKQANDRKIIEAAIGRWMKMYYCARDDGVFLLDADQLIPVEQMNEYLMRSEV